MLQLLGLNIKSFKLPADLASEPLANMLAHCGDNWHYLLRTWCPTYGNKHGVQAHRETGQSCRKGTLDTETNMACKHTACRALGSLTWLADKPKSNGSIDNWQDLLKTGYLRYGKTAGAGAGECCRAAGSLTWSTDKPKWRASTPHAGLRAA